MRFNLGNSSIINIFVMPDQDDGTMNSPFQGFLVDVFSDDYYQTMTKVLSYPINATEVFMSQQELIEYRCEFGYPNLFLLNIRSLVETLPFFLNHPFVCITCIGDELKFVKTLDLQFKYSPLIIGVEPEVDLDISRFNMFMLDDFIIKRTNEALNNGDLPREFSKYIDNRQPREKQANILKTPTRTHSVTHPNELVLMSVGFDFEYVNTLRGSGDKNVFINAIIDSSRNLQSILNYRRDDSKSDLIVYSPSIFTHLYNFKDHFWNQINRELKNKSAKSFIMNGVFKNPSYSGMDLDKSMIKDMSKVLDNKAFQAIVGTRQFELAYTTLAMKSLAIANMCPAVRVPNAINFHNGMLRDIESLSNIDDKKAKVNFQKKIRNLTNSMKEEIGDKLINFISDSESITLCTDTPLEWVIFNKVPLMFTHEVSKIHTTPGNQLLKISTNFSNFTFKHDELLRITVFRSFRETDPLKHTLEHGLKNFAQIDNKVTIKIVDVENEQELIEALNKVDTPILIFDCHGNHGGSDEHGWLCIGDDRVDVWNLPCNGKIPPIVILSACLTSAIGGSHASVANGLLRHGAITVLGTLLPVDAVKSSVFVGRIIYRLSGYLSALKSLGVDYLTWRKFLSSFFRMSFCTDVLTELRDIYGWLDRKQYEQVHFEANKVINMGRPDWFYVIVDKLTFETGKTRKEVEDAIDEIGFVETMNYSQLGRPENVIIRL